MAMGTFLPLAIGIAAAIGTTPVAPNTSNNASVTRRGSPTDVIVSLHVKRRAVRPPFAPSSVRLSMRLPLAGHGRSRVLRFASALALARVLGLDGAFALTSVLGFAGAFALARVLGLAGAFTLARVLGLAGAFILARVLGLAGAFTLARIL